MLERSDSAKNAKTVFYEQFNDVDIYVEDSAEGLVKLYTILLSRLLSHKYRIETVFPVGNKPAVVKRCREDVDRGGRKRVYIVDADLDLLDGLNANKIDRLYVLPRYCIENFLIDEAAAVKILDEEDISRTPAEIAEALKFEEWIEVVAEPLFELFLVYAAIRRVCPDVITVGFPINRLRSTGDGMIDEDRIAQRRNELVRLGETTVGECEFTEILNDVRNKNKVRGLAMLHYVSGKDYVLPLFFLKLRSVVKLAATNISLRQRLAYHCNIDELRDIEDCISA